MDCGARVAASPGGAYSRSSLQRSRRSRLRVRNLTVESAQSFQSSFPFGKRLPEEIARVPRWSLGFLGQGVAQAEIELAAFGGGVEVQRLLLHVVTGLVIVDGFPMLIHGAAVDLRIHRFVARIEVHRGHVLVDERALLAGHE